MAHIAILTIGAHGHINPTIDLVAEAVARGHRVTYCVPGGFGSAAETAGAQLLSYDSLLVSRPAGPPTRPGTKPIDTPTPTPTAAEFAAYLPFILLAETKQVLPQLLHAFADDIPDVLLYDRTAYATGRVLGEMWGRSSIEAFASFAYNEHFSLAAVTRQQSVLDPDHHGYRALADQLAELATDTRTTPLTVDDFVLGRTGTAIAFLPRGFQYAGDTFGPGYNFVGPCLRTRLAASTRTCAPVEVYASLGTAFTDRPEVYAAITAALGQIDGRSLLSMGSTEHDQIVANTGDDRIEIRPFVDQLAALAAARVFVTHAGMGGVMEALYFGVPLVCLPQTTEQQTVARRVAELGLGIELGADAPTPSDLHAAIESARTDPRIRSNVRAMRDIVRATGGATAAIDHIQRVLETTPRSAGDPFQATTSVAVH
ncbi:macrolide family glycosyltransferase [Actinopolymorpha pittospori]|uniref:MGT family glycosyltransferase n=1 Tax=Actinopolymorpha pittospori TaxID=648752 RepID=A0A927MXR1_9ACTN|nr:macrolide family glycosyltransferase [Actinopolymorpha pittospori]MBE1605247.1 MGT family glycosyltransferase [Actinopolymorpha pittospori]